MFVVVGGGAMVVVAILVKYYLVCYIYIYIYIYIYLIAEAERKCVPTIKEVVTNRIKKRYIMLFGIAAHRLKAINYNFSLR